MPKSKTRKPKGQPLASNQIYILLEDPPGKPEERQFIGLFKDAGAIHRYLEQRKAPAYGRGCPYLAIYVRVGQQFSPTSLTRLEDLAANLRDTNQPLR